MSTRPPAIVIVAYNRNESLRRLLGSLRAAIYPFKNIPLIISIDKSDSETVCQVARDFNWPYGEKILNLEPNRLGLRKHVIKCGELSEQYDSIVMLEDDLYVSPYFYLYTLEALKKYGEIDCVGGISLYSHQWNVNCLRPFCPADDGSDAYLMQFPQSWGQIWSWSMWKNFISWYEQNDSILIGGPRIPLNLCKWPNSSWLKYFAKYLIDTDKYFVYPRISLTTNFGDHGQHVTISSANYQVPLLWGQKDFKFSDYDNLILYDSFFERKGLGINLGVPECDLCVDLYGIKGNQENRQYWLTTARSNYKILKQFGLKMRPHEINILNNVEGNEIFLYNTKELNLNSTRQNEVSDSIMRRIRYDFRDIARGDAFRLSIYFISDFIKRRLSIIKNNYS